MEINDKVLIISENSYITTNKVIEWLYYFGQDFIRINENDTLDLVELNFTNHSKRCVLKIRNLELDILTLKNIWYRRGYLNISISEEYNYNLSEKRKVLEFIDDLVFDSNSIGSFKDNNLNKLSVLKIASEIGMLIPDNFFSGNKCKINLYLKHKPSITKQLGSSDIRIGEDKFFLFTNEIKNADLNLAKDNLIPFWIQEKINKIADVRVFYWLGIFYGAIIHSQNHEKSAIDSRVSIEDGISPRWEPYFLSIMMKNKINLLMKRLNLKSGSLDFAIIPNGNLVFFEVNPVGQFGDLSLYCNYNIEKQIAYDLTTGQTKKFNFEK